MKTIDDSFHSEEAMSQKDILQMIYKTLSDSIFELGSEIELLKTHLPADMPEDKLVQLVGNVRKLVVFLKYSSQYMRQTLASDGLREEILRIKLHLLSVLRALSDQLRLNDRNAVHDLITEELRDNLTLWKINVLPLLRPRVSPTIGSAAI
jgi:hypothetical protein